ncbi:MAG: hypothetical protein C4584_02225 [Armatimonadetes bacterium]|nr:MAG: hypothetical protein C4584_02225 [Armatimonadota bacterium]
MQSGDLTVTATRLVEVIAQISYDFWESERFRQAVGFSQLSRIEQDRIFNELEVTILGFVALQAEQYPLLIDLKQETVRSFLQVMRELGLEDQFIETWKLLIKVRFKEYKIDYRQVLKNSRAWGDLGDKERLRVVWARIETLTVNCLSHIRRGKVNKNDPLWNDLRKWLTMIELTFDKVIQTSMYRRPIGVC